MTSASAARRDRQVVRLLTLLRVLKEGGWPSIYELAARLHTRRETIYRDLRALQAIGYPIVRDGDGRLSHPGLAPEARATIPPILLTQKELAALVWATTQAGSKQPFRASLDIALLKLQSLAPGKEGLLGLALGGVVGGWARGTKDYTDLQPIILQLVEAIVARRRCLLKYQAPYRDRPNNFRYDPYRLLSIQGLLYCVGQVPVHDFLVTLTIDRIHAVTVTEEPFTMDPNFDLKKYEAEAFGVTWDKPMTVIVRFHPDQAPLRAGAGVAPHAEAPHPPGRPPRIDLPGRWHLRDHPLDPGLGGCRRGHTSGNAAPRGDQDPPSRRSRVRHAANRPPAECVTAVVTSGW